MAWRRACRDHAWPPTPALVGIPGVGVSRLVAIRRHRTALLAAHSGFCRPGVIRAPVVPTDRDRRTGILFVAVAIGV
jgi:hypothetical protein